MGAGFYTAAIGPEPAPRPPAAGQDRGRASLSSSVVAEEVRLPLLPAGLRRRSSAGPASGPGQRGLRLVLAFVALGELRHGHHAVALLELDDAHALRGAAGLANVLDLDPDELPLSVIRSSWSASVTDLIPTTGPFFSVTLTLMTPEPPRPW